MEVDPPMIVVLRESETTETDPPVRNDRISEDETRAMLRKGRNKKRSVFLRVFLPGFSVYSNKEALIGAR